MKKIKLGDLVNILAPMQYINLVSETRGDIAMMYVRDLVNSFQYVEGRENLIVKNVTMYDGVGVHYLVILVQ